MSHAKVDYLDLLKKNLIEFMDVLMESYPSETQFLMFRILIQNQIPAVDIMNYVSEKLLPLEKYVKERDDKFFLEHNVLFSNLNKENNDKVDYFKKMWTSKDFTDSDRDIIWAWFDTFLGICKKYNETKKQ